MSAESVIPPNKFQNLFGDKSQCFYKKGTTIHFKLKFCHARNLAKAFMPKQKNVLRLKCGLLNWRRLTTCQVRRHESVM